MFKFLRRLFTSSAPTSATVRVPFAYPPGYHEALHENLRRAGYPVENAEQRYPTLRADQFGADIAATANAANRSRRRIENNANSLR